jgi:arylsulfatase A-like enzyme
MRFAKSVVLAGAWLAATAAGPHLAQARVVLVGVDGGSWNLLDPALAAGELPNLAALAKRGVTGGMATVEPVNSPSVWTSIATGRSPAVHGISDFFATRMRVQAPSVFERLAAAGVRVGLYDYLVTWPPRRFPNGFVIPGWLRRDDAVSPRDVWQRAGVTRFVNSYDHAYTNEDYLQRSMREVEEKAPRWNALAHAFDVEVGAVTFYAIDMTSHRFWEAAYPKQFVEPESGYSENERQAIRRAVLGVDRSLGRIASALGPEDTIIVVSDHGFEAREDGSRNVWVTHFDEALAATGLDSDGGAFSAVGTFGAVSVQIAPGDIAERDAVTERTAALLRSYATLEGEPLFGTVEVLDIAERPREQARPLLEQLRQWVVRTATTWWFEVKLPEAAHAVVFALPNDDLLAPLWPDGRVSVNGAAVPLADAISRQRFTGAHHPTAIFLAAGGPIVQSDERIALSVLDVAPLLFYLSGQPLPDDLEGALPVAAIDPEHLATNPPAQVPASEAPALPPDDRDTVDDPTLVEKLRALGYIE